MGRLAVSHIVKYAAFKNLINTFLFSFTKGLSQQICKDPLKSKPATQAVPLSPHSSIEPPIKAGQPCEQWPSLGLGIQERVKAEAWPRLQAEQCSGAAELTAPEVGASSVGANCIFVITHSRAMAVAIYRPILRKWKPKSIFISLRLPAWHLAMEDKAEEVSWCTVSEGDSCRNLLLSKGKALQ